MSKLILTLILIFASTFALGQDTLSKRIVIGKIVTKCDDISESTKESIKIELNDIVHEFINTTINKDKNSFNITQVVPRDNLATTMNESMKEGTFDSLSADYVMLGLIRCPGYGDELKFNITLKLNLLDKTTIFEMGSKTILLTKKQLDSPNARNDSLKVLVDRLLNPNRQLMTPKIFSKDTTPLSTKKKFFTATNCTIMSGVLALTSVGFAVIRQEDWNDYYDQNNGLDVDRKYGKENCKFKLWQGGVIAGAFGMVAPYIFKDKKNTSKKESLSLDITGSLNGVGLNIKF